MSKTYCMLTQTILVVILLFTVFNTPCIYERCIVCDQNTCPLNSNDSLRKLTLIDWMFDAVDDIHFDCAGDYNNRIRDPR